MRLECAVLACSGVMVPETNLRLPAQINWWNRLLISLGRFFRWSVGSNLRARPLGFRSSRKPYVGGAVVSESFRLKFRRLLSRSIVGIQAVGFARTGATFALGTFERCRRTLKASAFRGRPEVIGARSE